MISSIVFSLLSFYVFFVRCTIQFTAKPAVLAKNGDNVTISWSGIPNVDKDDYIAFYLPPRPANAKSSTNFIGFLNASSSSGFLKGKGSLSVPLVNMRSAYSFEYVSRGKRVAVTNNVTFRNVAEPTGVHLALTENLSEMRVMFTSSENSSDFGVQWGHSALNLASSEKLDWCRTYKSTDMCAAPATGPEFIDPGFICSAIMRNLSSSTIYYYRVGKIGSWSSVFRFVTPPLVGEPTGDVFVYGDLGVLPHYRAGPHVQWYAPKTLSWVERELNARPNEPSLVFHNGDISYARGRAFLWDEFMSAIEPVSSSAPYMVSIGNHEYDFLKQPFRPKWSNYGDDSHGECGVPYSKRFEMPMSKNSNVALWYSFNYGTVAFVVFDTETDFLIGSPQWKVRILPTSCTFLKRQFLYLWCHNYAPICFIDSAFAAVNRSVTPFVILLGHRPVYTSSTGINSPTTDHLREALEPLLYKYAVDLCLVAHVHKYERTASLHNFTVSSKGTTHITVGGAGNVFLDPWESDSEYGFTMQPSWSLFRTANFGYSMLRANTTHLVFQFIGDLDGKVHDQVVLHKR